MYKRTNVVNLRKQQIKMLILRFLLDDNDVCNVTLVNSVNYTNLRAYHDIP